MQYFMQYFKKRKCSSYMPLDSGCYLEIFRNEIFIQVLEMSIPAFDSFS